MANVVGSLIDAPLRPHVDLRHTLADAIAVASLVDDARAMAVVHPPYAFGALPGLLRSPRHRPRAT